MGLRQTNVEREMISRSKGMQSCPGLRFDARVGNANTMMMLNWDASVQGRGRRRGGRRGGRAERQCQKYLKMKITYISPKARPGDQDWPQFEADSPDFAPDLAVHAVAAF